MTSPEKPNCRTRRAGNLCGASAIALVAGLFLAPGSASAQAFLASPTVTTGAATVIPSLNRTDIFIDSPEVIIDWQPFDLSTTTAPLLFQDTNTTAQFTNGSSSFGLDYTVLNRIVPVDDSGLPQVRTIIFDGIVESLVDNATGGKIWFWSPTGIIVGSNARFNVGSLLLTTNDIDTTGGLYGSAGEIRFRGPAASTGSVQVQFGAQINALDAGNAYVGLVAPSVVQGGTVRSDGAIAYVAAEQVDITFNAGMVDIVVTQGTEDATGITHFGTSGGPQSTGAADVQQLAMVAVPKNSALTMLLSGSIGYAPAASAANEGSAVILSAGQGLGFDTAPNSSGLGNITIGNALFTSPVTASASDVIDVNPDFFSTVEFQASADLYGVNEVNISAQDGSTVTGVSLTARSAENVPGGNGGSINLIAGPAGEGAPGSITFTGLLTLDASSLNQAGDANPDNLGGDITITALGGTIDAAQLVADASATGLDTGGIGGSGTGGSISLFANAGGAITLGQTDLSAAGLGSPGSLIANTTGGSGSGGLISFLADSGTITLTGPMTLDAGGTGGSGTTAGGSGSGGTIDLNVLNAGNLVISGLTSLSATGLGGDSGGTGGNATGGAIGLTVDNADFTANELALDAGGFGGFGSPFGSGQAGSINLDLLSGSGAGSFSVATDLSALASGDTPTGGTGFNASLNGMDAVVGGNAFVSTSRDASFAFAGGTSFIAGGGIDIAALNILAGTATQADGEIVAGGALSLFVEGTLFVNAPSYGATVSATSADIEIGSLGSLGLRGITSSLDLFNFDATRNMVVGGTGQAGAYSLDAGEATRIFADQSISFIQASDGAAADVFVDDLNMTYGPGSNVGTGGTIGIFANGRVAIIGNALFNTVSAGDVFSVNAAELDIVTDSGRLALRDSSSSGLGIADLFADRIVVATSDTLGQIVGGGLSTPAITALLDVPQTASGPDGFLQAGDIAVNVTDGFYVQNSGASDLFADRLGFSVSTSTLRITTASASTIISINGVAVDGSGLRLAGLDTVPTVLINGRPAIATGLFDPFSTINGCIIGATCVTVPETPLRKPEIENKVTLIDPALDILPPIETAEFEEDRLLPLVDEPVTGVGNDDLWQSRCDVDSDDCDPVGATDQ